MTSQTILKEFNIHQFVLKSKSTSEHKPEPGNLNIQHPDNQENRQSIEQAKNTVTDVNSNRELDKNEFRLLVKILQAIGHDCTYDRIESTATETKYQHPQKTLVFADISKKDNASTMNLSSLQDMIDEPKLKRAVWEKLKNLK